MRIETTNLSIQAAIDARVVAFMTEVADLVRRVALQSVQDVLEALDGPRAVAPKPRRTAKPARARASAPHAPPESAPAPEPAPARRSIKEGRRGRLIVVPTSTPPAEHAEHAPTATERPKPVVVRIPAKVPRQKRTLPVATQPLASTEPTPARDWVVVRRPARDRHEHVTAGAGTHAPLAEAAAPAREHGDASATSR